MFSSASVQQDYYASTVSSLSPKRGRSWRISSIVHILEERWGSYRMCNSEYCHPNTCQLKCLLVRHSPSWGHKSTLQYVRTLSSWNCCYVCTVCICTLYITGARFSKVWYNCMRFATICIRILDIKECFILTSLWQDPSKSLVYLWPNQGQMGIWMCPGVPPKVNWPSLGMRWSTKEVMQISGEGIQSHLPQTPFFLLDWMLEQGTLLKWEQCLKLELDHGVKR